LITGAEIGVGVGRGEVGDEVTFTCPGFRDRQFHRRAGQGELSWWLDFIKDRLSQDSPLPVDVAERDDC
jgi:hypothetical protein